jgi:uncharacterized protein YndB with AHSA1/START domain
MNVVSTDRIEKSVILRAPRTRVWNAIADSAQFGEWFGVRLAAPFVEGATLRGQILDPAYDAVPMEMTIERIEPERYFSYRWHPYAHDPAVDYSQEPSTLVEFTLADAAGGTLLTVVESGFDRLPPARRAEAFRMNEEGWAAQLGHIERYLAR